jgi:hypothetical protein
MPRAGLTREKVVEQAAAAADNAGLDNLTLAAVAQRRGVSLPGVGPCASPAAEAASNGNRQRTLTQRDVDIAYIGRRGYRLRTN